MRLKETDGKEERLLPLGELEARLEELAQAQAGAERMEKGLAVLTEGLARAQKIRTARRQASALDRDTAQEERRVLKAEETLARADETRATLAADFSPPGKLSALELNVFVGKYLGLTLSLLASLTLGFGISGIVLALNGAGAADPR